MSESTGNPSGETNTSSSSEQAGEQKANRVKRILIPVLTIALVLAISVVLFVFRKEIEGLKDYAYLGVFVVSILSSATIILPVPGILVFIPLLATLNPALVGIAAGSGGIIGELTGYAAGYSGRGLAKPGKMYYRVQRWMQKWGLWTVFFFAVFLPFDVVGLVAGVLHYPIWKFMLMGWLGKMLKFIGLAYAAAWGWEWVLRLLNITY
jgi:membrane protein YqaA with SNARE-associated domain